MVLELKHAATVAQYLPRSVSRQTFPAWSSQKMCNVCDRVWCISAYCGCWRAQSKNETSPILVLPGNYILLTALSPRSCQAGIIINIKLAFSLHHVSMTHFSSWRKGTSPVWACHLHAVGKHPKCQIKCPELIQAQYLQPPALKPLVIRGRHAHSKNGTRQPVEQSP